ncbi:MAG: hypothetical protein EB079_08350 [Verrucomicrobia bacterium]|nr:hypothetical protein [Verrucomicrobiota bacterium]
MLSFLRKGAGEELLVVINLSNQPLTVALRGVDLKKFEKVEFSGNPQNVMGSSEKISLPGFGWSILKKRAEKG